MTKQFAFFSFMLGPIMMSSVLPLSVMVPVALIYRVNGWKWAMTAAALYTLLNFASIFQQLITMAQIYPALFNGMQYYAMSRANGNSTYIALVNQAMNQISWIASPSFAVGMALIAAISMAPTYVMLSYVLWSRVGRLRKLGAKIDYISKEYHHQ